MDMVGQGAILLNLNFKLLILTVLLLVEVSSFNQQLNLRTGQTQLYSQSVGNEAVLLSLVCVADFELSVQDVILFS